MLTDEQQKEANAFYTDALEMLNKTGASYMLGGAFALFYNTGIWIGTDYFFIWNSTGIFYWHS